MDEQTQCEVCKEYYDGEMCTEITSDSFGCIAYVCYDCLENRNVMICNYCGRAFDLQSEEHVYKERQSWVKCRRCLMAERQSRVMHELEIQRNIYKGGGP